MTSEEIRKKFLQFFEQKQHIIVPSAPMVVKNDPTLMFTNAGMNQFKEYFLGNATAKQNRIANSQKCLRVSGKHNDLEEVGHDTYHHTMFEMLGNWSFGDYFKKEAIEWSWELLTGIYGIDKNRLYVTVFEGSEEEKLATDDEAMQIWETIINKDHILKGSKKDNFWEMGDTGPCGPCSEIHIDLREEKDRKKTDGKTLVNTGHPQVIEIWNLVFIQYNRKADQSLELLPAKHIDTGMGFERLCRVLQNKTSNYDTDIFVPVIKGIEAVTSKDYMTDEQTSIAMRVIADHIRAVSFAIADGELPSNTGAGYVIRRILRRAIRYGFTYLGQTEPFISTLLPYLIQSMGNAYPELKKQKTLIEKVIHEEELSFLRTLDKGIKLLDTLTTAGNKPHHKKLNGETAFKLYDTYGFPLDLTELICKERGFTVDREGFENEMKEQKSRSRQAAATTSSDWVILQPVENTEFVGYDKTSSDIIITRYRKVTSKEKTFYQLVFDNTPFYAEGGGQTGDSGQIIHGTETIPILNTIKENNLILHITPSLPQSINGKFKAIVDRTKRQQTMANHSATHLLHYALRKVLGAHVEQKGSLVHPDYLRFDFAHFQKMSAEEIARTEQLVNEMIRSNTALDEQRSIPYTEALQQGAMALFGEKYGEKVRMIRFGQSVELCGGTHVSSTGQIGIFKILSEGAIAAGIRRIEAVSGIGAQDYYRKQSEELARIREALKNTQDIEKAISQLINENELLKKQIAGINHEKILLLKKEITGQLKPYGNALLFTGRVDLPSAETLKDLCFALKSEISNLLFISGAVINEKPTLAVTISESLVKDNGWNAGLVIREAAKIMDGGGGGQPFFAMAGGKNAAKLEEAMQKALLLLPAR